MPTRRNQNCGAHSPANRWGSDGYPARIPRSISVDANSSHLSNQRRTNNPQKMHIVGSCMSNHATSHEEQNRSPANVPLTENVRRSMMHRSQPEVLWMFNLERTRDGPTVDPPRAVNRHRVECIEARRDMNHAVQHMNR